MGPQKWSPSTPIPQIPPDGPAFFRRGARPLLLLDFRVYKIYIRVTLSEALPRSGMIGTFLPPRVPRIVFGELNLF